MPPVACDSPYALGDKGKATYPGGSDVVVEWPACPRRWYRGRRFGASVVGLFELCKYALERDVHKAPHLGAPGHRLLMETLRIRETPGKLLGIKRLHEKRDT